MKPIQIQFSVAIGSESLKMLANLLATAIEQGIRHSGPAESGQASRDASRETPKVKMSPLEASQHAHYRGRELPDDMGLLVDTRQACKLLGVSARKLWQMYNSGEMPVPTRIGRAVRWSYEELRAWVNAGCPRQDRWHWPS